MNTSHDPERAPVVVTARIGAQGAQFRLGQVVAPLTRPHPLDQRHQSARQSATLFMWLAQQMVHQPLRAFAANAGQPGEFTGEIVDNGHRV